jgi:hypothetical protein
MKRREFLVRAGQAATMAAVTGDLILINNGCQPGGKRKAIVAKPDFEVAPDPLIPKVALARNQDHARALGSALDAVGGIRRFVKKGEKVLLKPNVAFDRVPEQAVNTNPVLVGEMVRQSRIAGASEILVTDNGPNNPRKTFSRCGLKKAVEQNGGKVLYLNAGDFVEDNLKGKFITNWLVLKYTFEVIRGRSPYQHAHRQTSRPGVRYRVHEELLRGHRRYSRRFTRSNRSGHRRPGGILQADPYGCGRHPRANASRPPGWLLR